MTAADELRSAIALSRAGNRSEAWIRAASALDKVGQDRAAAFAFAELVSLDPTHAEIMLPAERVVAAFESDAELMIALTAALLRVAEQRPPDEPPFEKGPAHLAAGAAQRCFEGLAASARTEPALGGYLQINLADALRMMGPEHDADALQAYQLALAIDGGNGWWWFQLGLLHKWRGRFREALEANRKAFARLSKAQAEGGARTNGAASTAQTPGAAPKQVLWTLAIAATALGEGQLALDAWEQIGIRGTLSGGGLPYVPDMPPMQLRVATLGEDTGRSDPLPAQAVTFEVLWVQPLSPCHGVVQSPTVRRASIDYGDVVLWDGAPVRMNQVEGRAVPVFPLLWILRPGEEKRLRFVGMEKTRGTIDEVARDLGDQVEVAVFDRRVNDAEGNSVFYGKLLVAAGHALSDVRTALEASIRARAGITLAVPTLYELLGDTHAAGKAHQAWGGIERAAEKLGLLPRG